MLGVEAFPALLYSALCLGIPESPRWLITRAAATGEGCSRPAAHHRARGHARIELDGCTRDRRHVRESDGSWRGRFWSMRLRVPILLAFLVAFFNQLSGINAILYFAPRIFEMTGLGERRRCCSRWASGHEPDLHVRGACG
jgi:MFS transporter, SP family, arabinose:H+ symporter